jgi:RNA polymerase sigma factor (sigma-70 family)
MSNTTRHEGTARFHGRLRPSASEARAGREEHDQRLLESRESDALAGSARRWRQADRELATALDRPLPAGPGDSRRYLDGLGSRPGLPPKLERSLVAAAQQGDARARAELVDAFMPLIASVARLYRGAQGVDRLELLQEGVVGLLRAVERYDATRETPFWAYAKWWVRHAMQQLVSELTRPVVLSDRALRQLARLKDAHGQAMAESGREPSREELAARTGLQREQVDNLFAIDRLPRSTDETVSTEDGDVGTFGELLVDPLAEGEYERVLSAIEEQELLALLGGLSDRERSVLRARYGLDGEEQTLRQIADRLGVSAERVRQLEHRALGKLGAAAGVDLAQA